MQLHGIIPPIVTPMKDDESLDLRRLRELIDYLLGHKVHGIFVLGTTGEFYALDEREKQEVIATAVAHVNGRVPVLAGTGAETTREAVRLSQMAAREGVDAVSVITPYFVSPTQSEMADHYRRVAESASVPILLYSNPGMTGGVKLEPETVARLAEVPGIVGIKDSAGDLQFLIEMVRLTPPKFAVFQGRDTLIAPALEYGAKGAVPGTANIVPSQCVAIYEAYARGDLAAARAAQARVSPVRLTLGMMTAPGGIKAAMNLLTPPVPMGPSRSPLAAPSADKIAKVRAVFSQLGI